MSKLVVDFKDIKGADPAAILTHCSKLAKPFGIPSVVIRPVDVPFPEGFLKMKKAEQEKELQHILLPALQKYFGAKYDNPADATHTVLQYMAEAQIKDYLRQAMTSTTFGNALSVRLHTHKGKFAHEVGEEKHVDASWNLVVGAAPYLDAKTRLCYSTGIDASTVKDLPGTKEQWQLAVLWHELAHGTGAGEPHADKMSAIVYRQLQADPSLLHVKADIRAVTAILGYKDEDNIKKYGWPMVEVNDEVARMTPAKIASMSEDDIKAIRFDEFDWKLEAVEIVGEVLAAICPKQMKKQKGKKRTIEDLKMLGDKVQTCINLGCFDEVPEAKAIARRFFVAATRLSAGMKHYDSITKAADVRAQAPQPKP